MRVYAHVREKSIMVQCGDGNQKLKWLGHVGIARYDSNNGMELGVPRGVKTETGEQLDMSATINSVLKDGAHVWIVLGDEEAKQL